MDTDALRWFQQVADGATVTQVGEVEHVTQSGVSRALARLEVEVGAPLLRRSGRTLRLTRAGAAFKHHVDALLHQLDDGLASVTQLVDPELGSVALAFQPSLGSWLVPDLVGSFRLEHPAVRFDLVPLRDDVPPHERVAASVDLELATARPAAPGSRWMLIGHEPLHLAVPADHRLAAAGTVRFADAAAEPFVRLRATAQLTALLLELGERAGFTPRVAFEADDLPTVRAFVAAGLGVALLPAPRVVAGTGEARDRAPSADAVRHLPLSDAGARRELTLSWSEERRLLPAAALFREHVLHRSAGRLLPRLAGGA